MKIVLIGPVYPYKGGISHYTGLMYQALCKKHDVHMVSYKMQYPKFLFKKEQKDYSNDKFRIEDTKYWLNTANPFNIIHTGVRIKKLKPDVVIIQWWHPYFAPCYWLLAHMLGRAQLIFVCHNVLPHERFLMDRFLTKMVLRSGNSYVVQSHQGEEDLCSIVPKARHILTPHPTYNAFKIQNLSMEEGRDLLGVSMEKPMLLFFGFVREYKGLKHLLKAMPMICESLNDLELWIVGDFGEDKEDYLKIISELKIGDKIRLVEGYVPDGEVEKYFAATNLVVLPYESATQSGIVQIAYGFEKPVVVTNVGGLPDVVLDGKTGYVVESRNEKQLAGAVVRYFAENKEKEFESFIRKEADKYSWERMVENIEKLF